MERVTAKWKIAEVAFAVLCLGFILLVFGLASSEVHSFDIFWQLQSGKYIWQTKQFIYQDTFSLSADTFRYEHCWLHDLIFWGGYQLGGYQAISLLKGLLVAALPLLAMVVARRRQASWGAIFVVLPAPILMSFWSWKERPQLWSFLGLLLLILLLDNSLRSKKPRFWPIMCLLVFWANLHAGYILAFPVIGAFLVGFVLDRALKRNLVVGVVNDRRLWILAGLFPLAALLTPYGIEPFRTLLASPKFGEASGAITQIYNIDWNPTSFASYPAYYYFMGLVAAVLLLAWKKVSIADLILLGGLAFMGTQLERHTVFIYFAAAAILPPYIDFLIEKMFSRGAGKGGQKVAAVLLLILGLTLIGYWGRTPFRDLGFFQLGLRQWHYPIDAAEFIKNESLPGNLFNTYGAGGYLMWALFPDYKVFYDGRQTDPEMFQQGLKVEWGRPEWEVVLRKHGVNTLVLESCSQVDGRRIDLLNRLGNHPDWALVFVGETHLVFVRTGSVDEGWLRSHRLPFRASNRAILNEALQLLNVSPLRRQALWEVARVLIEEGRVGEAHPYLQRYLEVTPPSKVNPLARQYSQWLNAKGGRN